jgi:hypothetical protein
MNSARPPATSHKNHSQLSQIVRAPRPTSHPVLLVETLEMDMSYVQGAWPRNWWGLVMPSMLANLHRLQSPGRALVHHPWERHLDGRGLHQSKKDSCGTVTSKRYGILRGGLTLVGFFHCHPNIERVWTFLSEGDYGTTLNCSTCQSSIRHKQHYKCFSCRLHLCRACYR